MQQSLLKPHAQSVTRREGWNLSPVDEEELAGELEIVREAGTDVFQIFVAIASSVGKDRAFPPNDIDVNSPSSEAP
jgi:hypothetical protein